MLLQNDANNNFSIEFLRKMKLNFQIRFDYIRDETVTNLESTIFKINIFNSKFWLIIPYRNYSLNGMPNRN